MVERRGTHRVLVGNHAGKGQLGRLKRVWDDKIKMDLQGAGCAEWTGLIWIRTGTCGGHL
jgi:hypothetical protein